MYFIFLLFLLFFSSNLNSLPVRGKTFFWARPNFQSSMPERVSFFRNNLLVDDDKCYSSALEIVPYGGKSTYSHDGYLEGSNIKLARFFLPPGCDDRCLMVEEINPAIPSNSPDFQDYKISKNLEAQNFNIVSNNWYSNKFKDTNLPTFKSKICINPEQEKFGIGFCYKQTISLKDNGDPGYYLEAAVAIERITNNLNFKEEIINDGGGAYLGDLGLNDSPHVDNMTAAFKQKGWLYAKLVVPKKDRTRWGIADSDLKIGYNYITRKGLFNTYFGLTFPVGTKSTGKYLFEPIVGNNRHFGFMFGATMGFDVLSNEDKSLGVNVFLDSNTKYLFSNHQKRSFDLVGKPWGRYLSIYRDSDDAYQALETSNIYSGSYGINKFTHCVKVQPHVQADINGCWSLNKSWGKSMFQIEGGYNFFARQGEVIKLDNYDFVTDVAIKDINGNGATTKARNIKADFPNSNVPFENGYLRLAASDIDLESAAHPATIINTLYLTSGYQYNGEMPLGGSLGVSYEFVGEYVNTALNRWLLWGKFYLSF